MPRSKSVPAIFEEFVSSLSALIKVKVAESVQAAMSDFFAAKFAPAAVEESKPVRRRRRRRHGGRKPEAEQAVAVVGHKRGRKRGPKPVRLSKHGKRIGRPPKKCGP